MGRTRGAPRPRPTLASCAPRRPPSPLLWPPRTAPRVVCSTSPSPSWRPATASTPTAWSSSVRSCMKPVCDHRNYCRNDKKALYIGQSGHLAYKPRHNNNYSPAGFSDIRGKWDSLCSYTNNANGNNALCNIPTNTHAWRNPGQYNPGFVCGKPGSFMAKLGAKNGVKAATYEFTIGSLLARGGKYSDRMVDSCKQYGMKPVCDHRNYCKNDKKSLYIGQTHHLAYAPHRNNNGYIPSNTHAWRHPGQYNPGFVCGKVAGGCTAYQVANSNYAKKSSITGFKGTSVTVKCSSGFTGGGKVTCGSNGKF